MRQINEFLLQMRNSYRKLKQDGANFLNAADSVGSQRGATAGGDPNGQASENLANGVGEINDIGEFGLGVAPRDSRPVFKIEMSKEKEAELAEAQRFVEDAASQGPEDMDSSAAFLKQAKSKAKLNRRKPIDKQDAFLEFKQESDGMMLEESIRDNRNELKTIKVKVTELTA